MADKTQQEVATALTLTLNEQSNEQFQLSGVVPSSIAGTEIKKTVTILGITPEEFQKQFSTVEFNFTTLCEKFGSYCKDFDKDLEDNTQSCALEFCTKMLFEYGPYIRTERKSKGDKAIRIKFPCKARNPDGVEFIRIKVVIITTFKEMDFTNQEDDGKLVLTFRQAGLLAMVTFVKAIEFCMNKHGTKLLTPLCGAIFSRESVDEMSKEMRVIIGHKFMKLAHSWQ